MKFQIHNTKICRFCEQPSTVSPCFQCSRKSAKTRSKQWERKRIPSLKSKILNNKLIRLNFPDPQPPFNNFVFEFIPKNQWSLVISSMPEILITPPETIYEIQAFLKHNRKYMKFIYQYKKCTMCRNIFQTADFTYRSIFPSEGLEKLLYNEFQPIPINFKPARNKTGWSKNCKRCDPQVLEFTQNVQDFIHQFSTPFNLNKFHQYLSERISQNTP